MLVEVLRKKRGRRERGIREEKRQTRGKSGSPEIWGDIRVVDGEGYLVVSFACLYLAALVVEVRPSGIIN